jgi:hypothetical protein
VVDVDRKRPPSDRPWTPTEVDKAWTVYRHAHTGAIAVSAVERVLDSKGQEHLEWHVSVSGPKMTRPGTGLMDVVRRDFDMADVIEDNHVRNGKVRNLWLRVNPADRGDCDCVGEREEVYPIDGAGDEGGEYVYRDAPEMRP